MLGPEKSSENGPITEEEKKMAKDKGWSENKHNCQNFVRIGCQ